MQKKNKGNERGFTPTPNNFGVGLQSKRGFTLIEILVVIGIIAILAAVVLIAINPARQFAQANDSQRESNVNAIINAVGQYMADNQGDLPSGITGSVQVISKDEADICGVLVPDYMPALPVDPDAPTAQPVDATGCSSSYDTAYTIIQASSTKRITVAAPNTEVGTTTIQVTR